MSQLHPLVKGQAARQAKEYARARECVEGLARRMHFLPDGLAWREKLPPEPMFVPGIRRATCMELRLMDVESNVCRVKVMVETSRPGYSVAAISPSGERSRWFFRHTEDEAVVTLNAAIADLEAEKEAV